MHKLMRYIKGYEKQALLAPLFKMLEACFELFVPLVIASIIDTGIKNGDAAFIWTRCGLLVLLAVIGLASSLTAQWFSANAALGFGTALRKDLFRHIDTLSYSELDGIGTPTLVTRMTSDINQAEADAAVRAGVGGGLGHHLHHYARDGAHLPRGAERS